MTWIEVRGVFLDLRKRLGLKQWQVAKAGGINQPDVSRLESNMIQGPSVEIFVRSVQGLGISLEEFFLLVDLTGDAREKYIHQIVARLRDNPDSTQKREVISDVVVALQNLGLSGQTLEPEVLEHLVSALEIARETARTRESFRRAHAEEAGSRRKSPEIRGRTARHPRRVRRKR